jgi:tellurite resistance protein TehA-like permease
MKYLACIIFFIMLIIYETRLDIFRGNSSNKSRNQDRR